MIEGLAVWAAFIYLLRLLGVPWNKPFQLFAFGGGFSWLVFVWIGLLNYTPMDLSGGSFVQSPRIQLRPGDTQVRGQISEIYISPNQKLQAGQLVYQIDPQPYQIALERAQAQLAIAKAQWQSAEAQIDISEVDAQAAQHQVDALAGELQAAKMELALQQSTSERYQQQNRGAANTISAIEMEQQQSRQQQAAATVVALQASLQQGRANADNAINQIALAKANAITAEADSNRATQDVEQARWRLQQTTVRAPMDGYVTNFIARPGQMVALIPRLQMYTNEKYVLMRVNHQAIRNIKVGSAAEFATPVYPGKVFAAEVEGIIEATGESQANLLGLEEGVRSNTAQNARNKHHFVRLKLVEPEGYDIPVGAVGLAWVSGEKPIAFMGFLDVIRGIILRMKAQLYFVYSI
ncbi:HlyD family secretion protein [Ferrimonas senticii]|uniref:HlyD family secretion protein n=1 Tax=Ferrimonas senticii TaxID=394566 RepID=UPI00041A28EE|nr:efflux RND transporter periplasmic adaptor subunit [Ferrimonas senticii]